MKRILLFFILTFSMSALFGQVEVLNENFDAGVLPAGWTTATTSSGDATPGACGDALFSFQCTGGVIGNEAFTGASGTVAIIDDDAAGTGVDGIHSILTPVIDLSDGGISMTFDWINDDFAGTGDFVVEVYDGAAWVEVFREENDAQGQANIDISAYNNADFQVRFSYDDEIGWNWGAAFDNVIITALPPVGPGGATCNLICPPSVNYTLGSGECNVIADFTVNMVGSCPGVLVPGANATGFTGPFAEGVATTANTGCIDFAGNPATLTMASNDLGVTCDPALLFGTWSEYAIPFDGILTFDWSYTPDGFGSATFDPFGYFFDASNTFLTLGNIQAGITQLTTNGVGAQTGTTSVPVSAGDLFSFMIFTTDGLDGQASVDITNLVLQAPNVLQPYTVVPTAATPALGDELAPGTYPSGFDLLTPGGQVVESCAFDVVVNAFAGVNAQLNCVGTHQFSFDENCEVTITAADILQGSNYGCLDDYTVNILSNTGSAGAPVGSPLGNVADYSYVGQTWTVMVQSTLDPNNACWTTGVDGGVTFEDKMAPTISCGDLTPVSELTGTIADGPFGLNLADNGAPCWNLVTTFLDNSHPYQAFTFEVTTAGSYSFEMGGITDGLAALYSGTFDPNNLCAGFIAGDDDGGAGLNPLITVDLTPGTYTYVATNTSFPGGGSFGDFTVSIDGPAQVEVSSANITISCTESVDDVALPIGSDNCDANPAEVLISSGWLDQDMCSNGVKVYQKTWKAIDASGMESAPCTQTITITQPTITFPENITWTCDQYAAYPGVTDAATLHANITDWDTGDVQNDIDVNPAMSNFVLSNTGSGLPTPVGSNGNDCNYNVEHTDQTFPHCGDGTLKIHRLWTITNICTGAITTHTQLIVVADIDAPVMDFTALSAFSTDANGTITLTVSANGSYPNTCNSTSFIPAPAISDNCSGMMAGSFSILTPAGAVTGLTETGGYIPTPGIEVGIYTDGLTYSVTDNCGNTSEQKVTLIVQDDIAPSMSCDLHTTVTLNNNGEAVLLSTSPDDGSYDNCGIVGFDIRRMVGDSPCKISDTQFGPFVTFCCEDVNTTHMVTVRATDVYGNTNVCMVEVEVEDKMAPTCLAPAPVQVNCNQFDVDNLAQYGDAVGADNCDFTVTELAATGSLNGCSVGSYTRHWEVTEDNGTKKATCSQNITVNYVQNYSVKFPNDLNITACDPGAVAVVDPIFINNDCEGAQYTVNDEVFYNQPNACMMIERTYKIKDVCAGASSTDPYELVTNPSYTTTGPTVHSNATNNGRFVYTQIIMINDNVNPTVEAIPAEYCVSPGGCTADVSLEAKAQDACSGDNIEFSYILYRDLNGDGDYADAGETVFDDDANAPNIIVTKNGGFAYAKINMTNVPVGGLHKIKWFAEDNCGNSADVIFEYDVKDCKKPTIEATDGTVNIMSDGNGGGMITLWPGNPVNCWQTIGAPNVCAWNPNVGDNCTADQDLYIRVQKSSSPNAGQTPPLTATSVTYTCAELGTNEVELWVGDEAGNWDFITVLITIEDNMNVCGGPISAPIAGALMMSNNGSGVQDVDVEVASAAGNIPSTTVTSSFDGAYGVSGLPLNDNYTVTPTFDGTGTFASNGVTVADMLIIYQAVLSSQSLTGYQKLAADVDGNGSVGPNDLIAIRDLILGKTVAFPGAPAWRFFEAACDVNAGTCPEVIDIAALQQAGVNNADFVAVKMGDVNGSATSNMYSSIDDRSFGELVLNTADRMISAGEEVEITLGANRNDIAAYQFTLNFGNMEFVNVKGDNVSIDNFGLHLDRNAITTAWNGESLDNVFTLVLRATKDVLLSDALSLNGEITPDVAYNSDNEAQDVKLAFDGKIVDQFTLFQNNPNPFSDRTDIKFYLPEGTAAILTIFDASGRTLKTISNDYAKGMNQVSVAKSDLNAVGVLYYKLETTSNTAIMKMIIME